MIFCRKIPTMKAWTPLYSTAAALLVSPFRRTLVVQAFAPGHLNLPSTCTSSLPCLSQSPMARVGGHELRIPSMRHLSSESAMDGPSFKPGSKIQVEVVSFGPLGASVEVLGISHESSALLPEGAEPYAIGLIYQKEIAYFRAARDNVDVVRGEILPAYVQKVRDDGKLDIGLRAFGGKQKSLEVSELIMDRLEWSEDGVLPVGDKSPPEEINMEFPGVSKTAFKRAIGALYKKGLITPSPTSIALVAGAGSSEE